ncbi:hypothetical protein ESCO_000987 [Escovopsis weberi]|uniref:Uncharacterized protein n=1 Tax=Escovopsis weberi TaxID=150374 RepID=A0A0N0RTH7_ESCWE|nr:hypothetical protein ESCO_000987 [Escovopsis weberi]
MSISRAFTTRKLRMSFDASSEAKSSQRNSQPLRHKISAPMQLLHTTNILSYNAPDLPRPAVNSSPISVASSSHSEHDSDSIATADTTPPASPETAKAERRTSPKRHHLSDFFRFPAKPLFPPTEETEAPPAIPRRAPSHTKKSSFEALARSTSVSRVSKDFDEFVSGHRSRSSSTSTRNCSNPNSISTRSLKHPAPSPPSPATTPSDVETPVKEMHPFGPELAQVTELAEEYSGSTISEILTEDAEYILSHGLSKFSADDYISAIDDLSASFFPEPTPELKRSSKWI